MAFSSLQNTLKVQSQSVQVLWTSSESTVFTLESILKEHFDLLWFFLMHIYTLDIWAGTWGELQIVVPAMND